MPSYATLLLVTLAPCQSSHAPTRRSVRSNRTASGWAVVKTWCVPVQKVKQRGFAMCSQRKVFAQVKLLLAQHKVGRQGTRQPVRAA